MGLDMYLTKKTYVGAEYDHRNVTGICSIEIDGKRLPIQFNRISYIEEAIGYWRKANHIHKWFVENVQDGKDDCGTYEVEAKHVKELLSICKKVQAESKLIDGAVKNGSQSIGGVMVPIVEEGKEIKNPKTAKKLLPTTSGFFFGSTDYDQYYMQDIENTIEILEPLLKEVKQTQDGEDYFPHEIYYHSSW